MLCCIFAASAVARSPSVCSDVALLARWLARRHCRCSPHRIHCQLQNTLGVESVHVPPLDVLRRQLSAVLSDLGADALKTGMLPTPEVVAVVAEELQQALQWGGEQQQPGRPAAAPPPPLVVDPVLVSTSGDVLATAGEWALAGCRFATLLVWRLCMVCRQRAEFMCHAAPAAAGAGVVSAIKARLFPLAAVVTPNIPEAEALLGRWCFYERGVRRVVVVVVVVGEMWGMMKWDACLRSLSPAVHMRRLLLAQLAGCCCRRRWPPHCRPARHAGRGRGAAPLRAAGRTCRCRCCCCRCRRRRRCCC